MTSQPIRLSTNFMTLIPSLTFTKLLVASMENYQRVWHASRERLHFLTPGSVPLFLDLLVLQLLRPDSSKLPCLYSFPRKCPLVFSRFRFVCTCMYMIYFLTNYILLYGELDPTSYVFPVFQYEFTYLFCNVKVQAKSSQ